MSCLVIPLHQQLVAGVQDAAASDHQNGSHRRSLADGYDSGIIGLPVALKSDDELLAFTRRGAS